MNGNVFYSIMVSDLMNLLDLILVVVVFILILMGIFIGDCLVTSLEMLLKRISRRLYIIFVNYPFGMVNN
jgi:hypothetical protein